MTREPGRFATLNLAGYTVEVHWVKGLVGMAEATGRYLDRRIELDIDLGTVEATETLLHECIHAVEDIFGLDLAEDTVRPLSLGLHQMLRAYLCVF